jgi:hypothetical protein
VKLLSSQVTALVILLCGAARADSADPLGPEHFGAEVPDPTLRGPPASPHPVAVAPHEAAPTPASLFQISLVAGPALPHYAGTSLPAPLLPVVAASESAGIGVGASVLRLGLSQVFFPVFYRSLDEQDGTSVVAGVLAEIGFVYPLRPTFEVGASIAPGVLWWMGLGEKNPFTVDGASADGPVPMPTLELALTAGLHLTPKLLALFHPSFTASTTTSPGLARSISTFTRYNFLVGVAYAL